VDPDLDLAVGRGAHREDGADDLHPVVERRHGERPAAGPVVGGHRNGSLAQRHLEPPAFAGVEGRLAAVAEHRRGVGEARIGPPAPFHAEPGAGREHLPARRAREGPGALGALHVPGGERHHRERRRRSGSGASARPEEDRGRRGRESREAGGGPHHSTGTLGAGHPPPDALAGAGRRGELGGAGAGEQPCGGGTPALGEPLRRLLEPLAHSPTPLPGPG
jgi:hypothetical protein